MGRARVRSACGVACVCRESPGALCSALLSPFAPRCAGPTLSLQRASTAMRVCRHRRMRRQQTQEMHRGAEETDRTTERSSWKRGRSRRQRTLEPFHSFS